jgi:hypothetical protein
MNRIQRIQTFLDDYKTLNPNLKYLLEGSYEYFQQELIKEYIKVSKHPLPQEYLSQDKPKYYQSEELSLL